MLRPTIRPIDFWFKLMYALFLVCVSLFVESAFQVNRNDYQIYLKPLNHSQTMKRVCYYAIPNSSSWDKTLVELPPESIEPRICTHLIIAFGTIKGTRVVPKKDADYNIYRKVLQLKEVNSDLKVMLSLAGGFSELVKSRRSIDLFAFNAHQFLIENNFDGIDLDWEFPAWPATLFNRKEKKLFTYLVKQLYNALKLSSHPPLLLSIAVASPRTIVRRSYEVKELAQNVDFINLMGYDFRMFWSYFPFTGYNAPLYRSQKDVAYFKTLNIEWATNYWLKEGTPREKLVVGIPTYGRTWKLLSFLWHDLGSPAVSRGLYDGYITYPQALDLLKAGGTRVFDSMSKVPYIFRGRDWISYEDRESIYEKAKWIKDQRLAGVMTWNLNCDDFAGSESGRRFDLHHVIKEVLQS